MRELCSADQNPLGLHVVEEGETLALCEKYWFPHELRLNGLHAFPPPGGLLLPACGKSVRRSAGRDASSV